MLNMSCFNVHVELKGRRPGKISTNIKTDSTLNLQSLSLHCDNILMFYFKVST